MTKTSEYPSLGLYDQMGVEYILSSFHGVSGPLWTGFCMILDTNDSYGDAAFYHELAHWLAASKPQRELPDFGMGRNVNSTRDTFATSKVWYGRGSRPKRGWVRNTISPATAESQENLACAALTLYEPLCGIWSWTTKPNVSRINAACFDFAGMNGPDTRMRERLYTRIVGPLSPSTTPQEMNRYLDAFEAATTEEDY